MSDSNLSATSPRSRRMVESPVDATLPQCVLSACLAISGRYDSTLSGSLS
jgi:hypothetical protein